MEPDNAVEITITDVFGTPQQEAVQGDDDDVRLN